MSHVLARVVCVPFSHIGLTVPDLDQALSWYQTVFGFELISGPFDIDNTSNNAQMLHDIYGTSWGSMRQAHVSCGNGIGLEFFEFKTPSVERPEQDFEYRKIGCFHFCVVCTDVQALTERIVAHGGRQRTRIWTPMPNFQLVYCEDPFGIAIEINNKSYEQAHSNLVKDS